MSERLSSWSMTLAMDYGQFSLSGTVDDSLDPGDAELQALEIALAGDRVGKAANSVVILSPHQNNFAMQVTFEQWSGAPSDDVEEWDEAFEASLDIDDQGLTYGSPTREGETIALPAGHYGLRVCGRGFVARGWPGSTAPGDRWRWQAWIADTALVPRRLRAWHA